MAVLGVRLEPNTAAWAPLCDRSVKENIEPVDTREVLQRLVDMPVCTWKWMSEADAVRHMGPTAQAFHAAFGLGSNDKRIVTVDADGVALAAIQGLHELVREKDAEIEAQRAEIEAQAKDIADLTARLVRLERLVSKSINPPESAE